MTDVSSCNVQNLSNSKLKISVIHHGSVNGVQIICNWFVRPRNSVAKRWKLGHLHDGTKICERAVNNNNEKAILLLFLRNMHTKYMSVLEQSNNTINDCTNAFEIKILPPRFRSDIRKLRGQNAFDDTMRAPSFRLANRNLSWKISKMDKTNEHLTFMLYCKYTEN